jgi:hypothetical protein
MAKMTTIRCLKAAMTAWIVNGGSDSIFGGIGADNIDK